jgi:hypothetical protein
VTLLRLMAGSWIAHAVSLVARLRIPDLLVDGPRDGQELARLTQSHAPSLSRVLRALASLGLFEEATDGRFQLTPLAEPLRDGVPGSLRAFAIMLGEEWHWRAWGDLPHAVRTGQSAFEHLYGMTNFGYWAQHPEAEAIFDHAMTSRGAAQNAAVVAAYPFTGVGTLVDVGGGHGTLLASVLRAHPAMRGVLVDRPEVVAGARAQLGQAGVQGRCDVVAGDFFASVPSGGDAYLLKSVIHDWDDERAVAILSACRRALPEQGRLLLVEWVVPPGNAPSFAKLLDLLLLVWTPGGKERTEAEHRALLAAAGFELTRAIPTAAGVSVLEAVRT